MKPLSQVYLLSICEVKTMRNDLIATGILKEMADDYIDLVPKMGNLQVVRHKTPVKISIYNAEHGFCVLAGEVYTSNTKRMRIINLDALVEYERRNFFRVETKIHAALTTGEEAAETIPVLIRNISLSGFLCQAQEDLDQSKIYTLKLRLGKRVSTFHLTIRRVYFPEDGFLYGCEFLENANSSIDVDSLCAFIFERQREYLNKQRSERE